MTPGIYPNMKDSDYRAIDAVSNSDLTAWANGRTIDPKVANWGSAMHAAILEPEVARQKVVGLEPGEKRASHPLADSEDAWVLTNSEYRALVGTIDSIKQHPLLAKLRDMAVADRSRCEVVLIARDDETGLLLKGKVDQYTDKSLVDWKSTSSDPEGFEYGVGKYLYNMQAAFYMELAQLCGMEREQYLLACACKRPDKQHVCWLHKVDGPMLTAGYATRRILLNLYARHGQEQRNVHQ